MIWPTSWYKKMKKVNRKEKEETYKGGRYTGNGDSNGQKITLGGKPKFLMIYAKDNAEAIPVYMTWDGFVLDDEQDTVIIQNDTTQIINEQTGIVELVDDGFIVKGDLNINNFDYFYYAEVV